MNHRVPVADRFWNFVELAPACWLWTGALVGGYGKFKVDGKSVAAHRWSYEEYVGPIPEGLQLDHLCHTRDVVNCVASGQCMHARCVNPSHLEPVTGQENSLRGAKSVLPRVFCRRGHEWTPANSFFLADGKRRCRACARPSTT